MWEWVQLSIIFGKIHNESKSIEDRNAAFCMITCFCIYISQIYVLTNAAMKLIHLNYGHLVKSVSMVLKKVCMERGGGERLSVFTSPVVTFFKAKKWMLSKLGSCHKGTLVHCFSFVSFVADCHGITYYVRIKFVKHCRKEKRKRQPSGLANKQAEQKNE